MSPRGWMSLIVPGILLVAGCSESTRDEVDEFEKEVIEYHDELRRESEFKVKQRMASLEAEQREFRNEIERRFVVRDSTSTEETPGKGSAKSQLFSELADQVPDHSAGRKDVQRMLTDQTEAIVREAAGGGLSLVSAAALGDVDTVKKLLRKGADPNQPEKRDTTPLLAAVVANHQDVVEALLGEGADIEKATANGVTPLFAAVLLNHEDLAMFLLDRGASPHAKNSAGATVLAIASQHNLQRVVDKIRLMSPEDSSPRSSSEVIGNAESDTKWDVQSDAVSEEPGDFVRFPAASLEMRQPMGFIPARQFEGFQNEASQASVMVSMLPGPFDESVSGFTPQNLKSRQMTLRKSHVLTHEGKSARLLNLTQTAFGTEFEKWILVFGDEHQTRILTATFPVAERDQFSDLLKATVLSARFENAASSDSAPHKVEDKESPLLFVTAAGRLKRVNNFSPGKAQMFTADGRMPVPSPKDPMFIIAPSLGIPPITHQRQYAEQRLRQTAETKNIRIQFTEQFTVDGLSGYESIAHGEDDDSGIAILIYQVMLFDKDGYILMQGLADRSSSADLEAFKEMARSLKRQ